MKKESEAAYELRKKTGSGLISHCLEWEGVTYWLKVAGDCQPNVFPRVCPSSKGVQMTWGT